MKQKDERGGGRQKKERQTVISFYLQQSGLFLAL